MAATRDIFKLARALIAGSRRLAELARTPPLQGATELVGTLAARADEVVPDDVVVKVERGGTLKVEGVNPFAFGSAVIFGPFMREGRLEKGLPQSSQALVMVLDWFARELQKRVAMTLGAPWPSETAGPYWAVTAGEVFLWWGESGIDDAEVRLRPIRRAEINMQWPEGPFPVESDGT